MKKLPISVFIITRNEADRVPVALRSVHDWVDEMIVVDSGSEDNTLEVARNLGARTLLHEWRGYGPQKVFAESQCRNDWVLNIDADEEMSPNLRAEITALFKDSEPTCTAYTLPILPLHAFQLKGHSWTAHHHPIRLYRKSMAGFKSELVHDSVVVRAGKSGHLRGMVNHRSFRSFTHHLDKLNFYSSAQAEDLFLKGREPSILTLLFTPPLAFIKAMILRREFVNGVDGVITSYMYAFQRFIRLAKTRERFQLARRQKEPKE